MSPTGSPKVTLDVAELDGLGVKIVDTPNSVQPGRLGYRKIIEHGGTINVNRVTLEAESDGQDLTGTTSRPTPGRRPRTSRPTATRTS